MQPMRFLGRNVAGESHRVTKDVLDLCDESRESKKKRYDEEGEYREANRRIQKAVKKAKDLTGAQCEEI